ncbi:MAG: phosphoribosylglycinamide formyltransferase [Planctomycetes bacterium]|nr:phosphoribosylglycinamide formyltransferase [Planctomycetota bacterium]
MSEPIRIAGLISGGGRTLINILDQIDASKLNASVQLVIASRGEIEGIKRAQERDLEVNIIRKRDYDSEDQMHDAITDALIAKQIDLVCLCGYLRWFRVDEQFQGRVINIHPALLPDFGGQGMHGMSVHRAVIEANRRVSGCSVHFVDEHYDQGPVILQKACPVLEHDTEDTLAARVFKQECIAYPEAINLYAASQLSIKDKRVVISPITK